MPAQESEHIALKPSDKEASYTYAYEVGTRNELEIQGINPEDSYTYYEISANENAVDDRIAELENAYGAMEVVESPIEANDKINVSAIELDENNAPKKMAGKVLLNCLFSVSKKNTKQILLARQKETKSLSIYLNLLLEIPTQ
ncbi:MAG: hypothetical protein IPL23_16310 [Saprospiraceae bacterium]|nr:hypothetical protein [Saprospiraceae bacterium]